jgi:hypothetical protein
VVRRAAFVRPRDNLRDIIFSIFDKRQNRHQRDTGQDAVRGQRLHRAKSLRHGRRARLDLFTQRVVGRRDRETDGRILAADVAQRVQVAQNERALGDDVNGKAKLGNHAQRLAGQIARGFQRHIGIVHRAGADRAPDPLARQFLAQQINRVSLDQDVGKIVDPVALAARIAIDALMLAAPIQVHGVLDAEPGIGLSGRGEQGFGLNFPDHIQRV